MTKTKIKAKDKLPVEKWLQIFDRNLPNLPNLPKIVDNFMFLLLFCYILRAFSDTPFQPFFQESETTLYNSFV